MTKARIRSRIFILAIRSGGKAFAIARSIASNQASIIATGAVEGERGAVARHAQRVRGHADRRVAPAVEHGVGGDERRERGAQLVERHLIGFDHRSSPSRSPCARARARQDQAGAGTRAGRRISTNATQIINAPARSVSPSLSS